MAMQSDERQRSILHAFAIAPDQAHRVRGQHVALVDDVMTTGQSVSEYKKEIERHGGRVTAAIFYGKTVEVPPLFLLRMHVWYIQVKCLLKTRKR
jgi:predicted amidophosphoribosyltransferase